MSVLNTKLVATTTLTNAAAPYGSPCPNGVTQTVSRAVFANTDSVPHTVTAYCVATGGTAGVGNTILPARTLQPGESYVSPELAALTLNPGDQLYANASTGAVVTITVSGVQIS